MLCVKPRTWIFWMMVLGAIFLEACAAPVTDEVKPMPDIPITNTSNPPGLTGTVTALDSVIPRPVSVSPAGGQFQLTESTNIYVSPAGPEILAIGRYLAGKLRPSTGFPLPVLPAEGTPTGGNIFLALDESVMDLGEEGYTLTITPHAVHLAAYRPAGLFYGLQTIRQLLPAEVELPTRQAGPWLMPTGSIRDRPRFAWRGSMLDVARHFFSVQDVERYIDLIAYYKMNRFHIHLTDDQGWRLEIKSWPNLARIGGSTSVNDESHGYYTQEQYSELVAYAQSRYITLVPEIEMPGHINAALASYPELSCEGGASELYTGIEVGQSSLCTGKELTYRFLDDVIGEITALTPGPYIHIGGDEAASTPEAEYLAFIPKVQAIVNAHGKQMVGWEEISKTELLPSSIAQAWEKDTVKQAVPQGAKVIMSPAKKVYLDMKYDSSTPLGLKWAGMVSVRDAYDWEPATYFEGVGESNILGVEAPLWSETLRTMSEIEYMAFPRLPGAAEIGWSPAAGKSWDEYRLRLAAHGARLAALGVNFYRAPEVGFK